MSRIKISLIAALALAVAVGSASLVRSTERPAYASGAQAPAAKSKTILTNEVHNKYAFTPKSATIKVGTKVVWKNVSDAAHTVTGKGAWTVNKQLAAGKTVSFTFKKAGTYKYYCAIHPYMTATIVVKM